MRHVKRSHPALREQQKPRLVSAIARSYQGLICRVLNPVVSSARIHLEITALDSEIAVLIVYLVEGRIPFSR